MQVQSKRNQALEDFIRVNDLTEGITYRTAHSPHPSTITPYFRNGRVLHIVRYPDGGWDILKPVSDRNNIEMTLTAAAEYLETVEV